MSRTVGAHAVEGDVGHDERVVSGACGCGAGAAGAGAGAAGAGADGRESRRGAAARAAARRAGRRAARPVLDDPRDDHAPETCRGAGVAAATTTGSPFPIAGSAPARIWNAEQRR